MEEMSDIYVKRELLIWLHLVNYLHILPIPTALYFSFVTVYTFLIILVMIYNR